LGSLRIVFPPLVVLQYESYEGQLGGDILMQYRLNAQINLGIRMQEIDKDLERKTTSKTVVGWLMHSNL
jgi:hypothetical protein